MNLLSPGRVGGPHVVVAQPGVLLPLRLSGEPGWLSVHHVARKLLEDLSPGIAHEGQGANGRHQVPSVCSQLNKLLYLRFGPVDGRSLLLAVSVRVVVHGRQGQGVDHVHVDGG